MKKVELTKKEKDDILNELYSSFKTGYEFEDFLKPFLECIGLDEVRVTKRSGDGGVDLEGIRYGVIDNNDDSVKYIVQAKRYKPSDKIPVDIIDKLRGNMLSGEKGIIITTAGFSKPAIEKASLRKETPIVLIDGKTLVDICIENDIGFVYKPTFSSEELKSFYKKNVVIEKDKNSDGTVFIIDDIEKDITSNDIRARIISIPRAILELLPEDKDKFDLCFNGNEIKDVRISSDRRFFSQGITEMYRKYGLLTKDNVFNPSKSLWKYDGKIIYIDLIN
jgi:restriction endonuclease